MENHEIIYHKPLEAEYLPDEVVDYLDGSDLESRVGEAIRLSTVDNEGWPHAAQLSVGELLAVNSRRILIAIWPQSNTARNLARDGRLTLALVRGGKLLEVRLRAVQIATDEAEYHLAVFGADVISVKEHRAAYAEVMTGVTYRLNDPDKVLKRWRQQIAGMRCLS